MKTRVTRAAAVSTAVITAVLGLGLATAGPAAAADGTWRAYGNTNPIDSSPSTWRCAGSRAVTTDVVAQVCAIRSAGRGHVQGAVIVRNNRSSDYSMTAAMDLVSSGGQMGYWECRSSGVAANSWSVCFGRTLAESGPVTSEGWAKGVYLGISPVNQ